MCVCLRVDVLMPDFRLGVCVIELPRVLVLDMYVSEARVPVMTGLLCVFSFWTCELGVFVCARPHVWRGIIKYMISKINPVFGHSKFNAVEGCRGVAGGCPLNKPMPGK